MSDQSDVGLEVVDDLAGDEALEATEDGGALGSTTSSTRIGGVDYTTTSAVTFDSWHRPLTSTVTLPTNTSLGDLAGYSSTTSVTYDGIGQVAGTSLPAVGGLPAETVTTGYRRSGQAETLTLNGTGFTTPIVTSTSIGSTGLLTSRSYGNGVTRNVTWDQVWRTPTTVSASFGYVDGQTPKTAYLQRDTLTRDTVGRVTAIDDVVASSTQCYVYDGFNRLNAAWTTGSTCGVAPQASDTFWQVDSTSYATEWDYSGSGRILSIVNLATGGTSATSTYAYDDPSHPNAATGVTTGAVTDEYTYDDAGRQTTRTIDTTTTDLTWDVLSNLVETDGAGGHLYYVYDASGQRVAKITLDDPTTEGTYEGTATAYLGATEVTDPNTASTATGDLTGTRYYTFGGSTVAVRQTTGSTSALSLLLGDVQGSAQVMMQVTLNTGGAMQPASLADPVTRSVYTPYGSVRGADGLTIDHGWLNQVTDESDTGLIYLNARYYDPVLSRFLSPDPVMNPGDPRTLDPYRYADDNPVVFSDTSGLNPSCSGLSQLVDVGLCWSSWASHYATGAAKAYQANRYKGYAEWKKYLTTPAPKPGPFGPPPERAFLDAKYSDKTNVETQHAIEDEALWRSDRDARRERQGAGLDFSGTSSLELSAGHDAIWSMGARYYSGGPACGTLMECFVAGNFTLPGGSTTITQGHTVRTNERAMNHSGNYIMDELLQAHEYDHVYRIEHGGAAWFYLEYGADWVINAIAYGTLNPHDEMSYEQSAIAAAHRYERTGLLTGQDGFSGGGFLRIN